MQKKVDNFTLKKNLPATKDKQVYILTVNAKYPKEMHKEA